MIKVLAPKVALQVIRKLGGCRVHGERGWRWCRTTLAPRPRLCEAARCVLPRSRRGAFAIRGFSARRGLELRGERLAGQSAILIKAVPV